MSYINTEGLPWRNVASSRSYDATQYLLPDGRVLCRSCYYMPQNSDQVDDRIISIEAADAAMDNPGNWPKRSKDWTYPAGVPA